MLRTVIFVAGFLLAQSAFANAPTGQGQLCTAKHKCDDGLSCLKGGDGESTCQLLCNKTAKTQCPEDQRCVKDNGHEVCRPINDGVSPTF